MKARSFVETGKELLNINKHNLNNDLISFSILFWLLNFNANV